MGRVTWGTETRASGQFFEFSSAKVGIRHAFSSCVRLRRRVLRLGATSAIAATATGTINSLLTITAQCKVQ